MATLKATLNLASSTLFPIPLNFTEVVTENVNGNHSSFNTNILAAGATNVALYTGTAPGSGILYFYFKAAATNAATIDIEIVQGANTVSALRLNPGDIAFFPVDASVATTVRADNNDGSNAATLQYFYGERG
jgi:hypothetical protein